MLFFFANNVLGKTLVAKYYCIANDLVGVEYYPNKKSSVFNLNNENNHFKLKIFKKENEYFFETGLATDLWLWDSMKGSSDPYGPWTTLNGYLKLFKASDKLRFVLLQETIGKGNNEVDRLAHSNVYLYDGTCHRN